jgi:quercetin 2,3-dioxygenase
MMGFVHSNLVDKGDEIMSEAVIVRANEGKIIDPMPGETAVFKLTEDNSSGVLDFLIVTNGPKSGPPLHIHTHADELFYILEGSLMMKCGEELTQVSSGDLVYIPKGLPHTFANMSGESAKAITIFCPSGIAQFLEEVSTHAAPNNEVLGEIAGRHDLQIVGPPLAAMME